MTDGGVVLVACVACRGPAQATLGEVGEDE